MKRRAFLMGAAAVAATVSVPRALVFAMGGVVPSGRSYLIGEVGPEVFVTRLPARVWRADIDALLASHARREALLRALFPAVPESSPGEPS